MRLLAIAILVALPCAVHAEPVRHGLTFAVGAGFGGIGTVAEDDSPSATGPGASLEVGTFFGRRSAVSLHLGWATARDRDVLDPFDDPRHDITLHWFEAAAAYQRYVVAHGWFAVRAGIGSLYARENSPAYMAGSAFNSRVAVGARVGYDVYATRRDAIAIVADGEVLPFIAAIGLVGVEYRWHR